MIGVGGAITTITVQNTTDSAQANVPITFGQVFAVGDLPAASAAVELRAPDNSIVQCQLDAKVNHVDGSLRHGILSAIIPALAASASVTYSIVRKAAPATGSVPVPADFDGLNATVLLTDNGTDLAGPNAGTTYTADAAAKLAAGTYQMWLSGPIVSEWIVRAPLLTAGGIEHPDLHARFNIRAYAGQARAKIDYIVENNWAKPKTVPSGTTPWEDVSTAPKIYAFTLKAGATTVHTRANKGYTRTRLTFNSSGVYDGNATGLANDATVYTATITADGVEKPISITGSAAQTFGQLRALFNTQLGGAATCSADKGMLGLIFESATTGAGSSVVIAYGTLFPALSHPVPYRPVRGDEVVHYPGTRWKKTFWWGTEPTVHIAHDKTYLMASKAVPNYAPDLTGTTATITANLAAMKANEDIGQNGITKAYMGDVGYAPGIGILPEWTAMYLVNQGADAKYIMLKQADLLGSWPIHARDYVTDQPISFENWPYATFSVNAGDSRNAATGLNEKLPTAVIPAAIPDNRNRPDTAHHPDFCFVPYLVTGDHYYMEGLLFYHRFLGLNTNSHASYRDGRKCLWKTDQVRGQAWSLRTSAHARYITPDGHPLRSDIEYTMAENALWYEANYLAPAAPYQNNFGAIIHGSGLAYTTPGGASTGGSPWMDDFVTAACGRAVELGYAEYLPLLTFKAKNIAGRLTSGAAFCWQLATTYSLRYKESATGALYTNWNEVYIGTLPVSITSQECGSTGMASAISAQLGYTIQQNAMSGYPATISGYPANMQPAIAYCATYDTAGGDDAWTVFDGRAQKPDYNLGPQFAIVPRTLSNTPPADPEPIPDPIPDPPTTGITMTIADRVKDSTTTIGSGAFALAGAPEMNFRPFLTSPIVVGSVVPYAANHRTLNEWETGFGTLTAALTLARTTVTSNSEGTQVPIIFSEGIKDVSCDLTAEFMKRFASVDSTAVETIVDPATATFLIVEGGLAKNIAMLDAISLLGVTPDELPEATVLADVDGLFVRQNGVEKVAPMTLIAAKVMELNGTSSGNAAVASAITLIGPTGGPVSVESTNFTVGVSPVGGAISGTITITPSDGGAGGSFTPASMSLTSAAPTANFTYTPSAAAGACNISVTNNVDLANPAKITYTSTVAVANTAPAQMAAPTATAGDTTASVTLVAPANGGSAITGYNVTSIPAGGVDANAGTTALVHSMTGLVNGTEYTFTATATNAIGTSAASPASNSVTPAVAANNKPGAPTAVTATSSDTFSRVSGTAPASDGGSAITGYTATATPAGGGTAITGTKAALPVDIMGLTNGVSYNVTLRANNANGNGAESAPVSITPVLPAYTVTPYNSNAVKTTHPAATFTGGDASAKYYGAPLLCTNAYWNITPLPPSAVCGWGTSATVPPEVITTAQNSATTRNNGMAPMVKATGDAWNMAQLLWIAVGAGDSGPWFLWVKPGNGPAVCMNAGAGLMITGA